MKINLIGRGKRADITTLGPGAAEKIDDNLHQLALDVRAIINALRAYRVDLGSDEDVTGQVDVTNLIDVGAAIADAVNAAIAAAVKPGGQPGDVQYNDAGVFAGKPFRAFGLYSPLSVAKAQNSAVVMTHLSPELVFTTKGDTVMVWKPGP